MSLNENKKQLIPSQIPGKGHHETFEIVILLKHTRGATDAIDAHVPENGGTCAMAKLSLPGFHRMNVIFQKKQQTWAHLLSMT
jgi:hypothetical protein